MKHPLYTLIILACLSTLSLSGLANSDNRDWHFTDDTGFNADLIKYDPEKNVVTLQTAPNTSVEIPLAKFSKIDRAWLLEWAEFSQELEEMSDTMKGVFEHYQSDDEFNTDFYVYYPAAYKEKTDLPLLFLFHPSGKGARYVKRFMRAAEALDLIIVSSDNFRNNVEGMPRFRSLIPVLEATIKFDTKRFYMGGTSGGGMSAFEYSAKIDRDWAGIWSNGGWLGGPKFYELPFRKNMRVAMINGNNDRAANRWVESDTKVLESRDCTIALFSFEGGHQVPPPMVQLKSLDWMLNAPQATAPE